MYKELMTKLPLYETFIKESPKYATFENLQQVMQVLFSLPSIEEQVKILSQLFAYENKDLYLETLLRFDQLSNTLQYKNM